MSKRCCHNNCCCSHEYNKCCCKPTCCNYDYNGCNYNRGNGCLSPLLLVLLLGGLF